MPTAQQWRYRAGAGVLAAGAALLIYGWVYPLDEAQDRIASARSAQPGEAVDWAEGVPWRPWSRDAVEAAVRSGRTVFVDFTAAYCTVCKTNKAVAINTPEVRQKMQQLDVVAFQGDFTSGDKEIFVILQEHDRAGVPLDLIYPAGKPDAPIRLRPALSKDYLLQKLEEAGPSRVASALGSSAASRQ